MTVVIEGMAPRYGKMNVEIKEMTSGNTKMNTGRSEITYNRGNKRNTIAEMFPEDWKVRFLKEGKEGRSKMSKNNFHLIKAV